MDGTLPNAGVVGVAEAASDRILNSSPFCQEENLVSRKRTQNFEAAGEAILEMGRKSALSSQIWQ